MWFTEDAWTPIILFGGLAVVFAILWAGERRAKYLAGIAVCGLACVVTWFVEAAVVTQAERLEANVYALTAAFQRRDADAAVAFFSVRQPQLATLVRRGLDFVTVDDDLDVKDVGVEVHRSGNRAQTDFRANATIAVPSVGHSGHHPSRWRLSWQREGDDWRIEEVRRLNPLTGEVIGIFATK